MKRFIHHIFLFAISLCFLLTTACKSSLIEPESDEIYMPQVGQAGKDVVWVPSPHGVIDIMLDMANVTASDYVIDLGSGDGRTVIGAAKRGAKALGIEYNPDMVSLAKRSADKEGVSAKATFVEADIFESDFSEATVLTMFLLPSINLELRPKILDMKPGTRIVSNSFTMQEWKPDQSTNLTENCTDWCMAFLWIVPSKVSGNWELDDGRIIIEQEFQYITGTLTRSGKDVLLTGKLNGDQIDFKADSMEYTGTVSGNTISGTNSAGGSWKAVRQP